MKEGEETGVPGENPWRRASENNTYYSPKIQTPSDTRTRAAALVACWESRHAHRYTTRRLNDTLRAKTTTASTADVCTASAAVDTSTTNKNGIFIYEMEQLLRISAIVKRIITFMLIKMLLQLVTLRHKESYFIISDCSK